MSDEKYPFLNEVEQEVVPEVEVQPEVQPVETPQAVEPAAPVTPTVTEPHDERVPLAALKAEREKRQQLERRMAEIERERAQAQPEPPDFYADPQQFIAQREQQLTQRMHAALEEQARDAYSDYDAVLAELKDYAQENPAVIPQVFNAANPALAAYKLGKQIRELRAMKDPDQYRKAIEAEVRAKVEAEYAAREQSKAAAVAAIPPDLTNSRSARDAEVVPDDSLDSILASRKSR
jgi:hypothetical protein